MKKSLFILLTVILVLTSCDSEKTVDYEPDEKFADWLKLEPVINGFYGELFDDNNITADGNYKGFERLSSIIPIIYCNDDNSVIWRDYDKEAIYRLYGFGHKKKSARIKPAVIILMISADIFRIMNLYIQRDFYILQ